MVRYVIAGNSVAAVSAIEAIRKRDREAEIVVISPEKYTAYCRPLITYVLARDVEEFRLPYKRESFYKQHDVNVLYGVSMEGLDAKERKVYLSNGEKLSFDKLLIAIGGKPFIPPIENVNGAFTHTFTTIADMKAIEEDLAQVNRVVVIGAGMIGMKAAEALAKRGKRVVIVELLDRILPLVLDHKASEMAQRTLENAGISYILGDSVVAVERDGKGKPYAVVLKSGEKVSCDMVIVAVGVRPNVEPVKDVLKVNRGIVVDDRMETSEEGIFAAGDVVEAYDLILGAKRPNLIWPLAYRQGLIAGANMAGGKRRYVGGFPLNSIGFFGFHVISAGMSAVEPNSPDFDESFEILENYDEKRNTYKKVVIGNNRLMGYLLVNDIKRAGLYTGLIWSRIDVSAFKDTLVDEVSYATACYPPEGSFSYSFSDLKDYRRFGWAVFPKSYRKFFTALPSRLEEICAFDDEGVCIYGGNDKG